MKKKRIDLSLVSHSGNWLVESKALSYQVEEQGSLVLNRENEKSEWLVLSVGGNDPEQEFPSDGTEYKEITPFTSDEFDVSLIEAIVRYYILKALEQKKGDGFWPRLLSILNPPVFIGTLAIEGLDQVPEKSVFELQKRLKSPSFFERIDLIETPT